jgi:teichuronic acid biosynthesis glycosyltransferase TuaG
MKTSVIIAAYNASATIRATLDSILGQTERPNEILVADDGSTDETLATVKSYGQKVTAVSQSNLGAAAARNRLCELATGQFIAFLDADDIWHPKYLEIQLQAQRNYPEAVGYFTGHSDFRGNGNYAWPDESSLESSTCELFTPAAFLYRYNTSPAAFSSMSYFCTTRQVLAKFGKEPFQANGAEDSFLFNLLPTVGAVIYTPSSLVAYRIGSSSLSSNLVRAIGARVEAFERLERTYEKTDDSLRQIFLNSFASHRRLYGKLLMGSAEITRARIQFRRSIDCSTQLLSRVKSLAMLGTTYLPKALQPSWPPPHRVWTPAEESPSAKSSLEKA